METLKMKIEGMGSNHCVMVVRNTVAGLPGAEIKDIAVGKAEVEYDQNKIGRQEIITAINKAGYQVEPA